MSHPITRALVGASVLFGLACGGPAEPTEEPTPQVATGDEAPAPTPEVQASATPPEEAEPGYSDAELQAFADVIIMLTILEQEGEARVQRGESMEDVVADLQPRADAILANSPLTPQRFNELAKRADVDPVLAERIQRQIDARLGVAAR